MPHRLTGNMTLGGTVVGIFDTTLHQVGNGDPDAEARLTGTLTLVSGTVLTFDTALGSGSDQPEQPPEPEQPPGAEQPPGNPQAPPEPARPPVQPGSSGRTLTVGPGYTVASQMAQANDGDTIVIPPGTPRESFEVSKVVLLDARGVKWDFSDYGDLFQGKGAIVAWSRGWHIRGIEISGAGIRESEAGLTSAIRVSGEGWGVIESCHLHDNQVGIGADHLNWVLEVRDTDLHDNGLGDGQTHNIYVNDGCRIELHNTHSTGPRVGHALKSRAWHTVVTNSLLSAADGTPLDAPEGGQLDVSGTTLVKPEGAPNHRFHSYAVENQNRGALTTSRFRGCTLQLDCDAPFVQVAAGAVTFDPDCTWSGNTPRADGAGTVNGLPTADRREP